MNNMDDESYHFKAFFLIDIDSIVLNVKTHSVNCEQYCNVIRVATLKLLYSQFTEAQLENKQFQWAFKLFSSSLYFNSILHKYKSKVSFQDLTLQNYESFETNLEHLLSNLVEKRQDDSSFLEEPVDILKKQLYDVITDYPWSVAGFQSPVKKSSSIKKLAKESQRKCQNMLYFFSFCPHTTEHLNIFTGHSCVDISTLLQCFISEDLKTKFWNVPCSFRWIDLNLNTEKVNSCDTVKNLMIKALEKINGTVVPIQTVVYDGKLSYTYLLHCVTERSNTGYEIDTMLSQVFPCSSSVRDLFLSPDTHKTYCAKLYLGKNSNEEVFDVSVLSVLQNHTTSKLITDSLEKTTSTSFDAFSSEHVDNNIQHILSVFTKTNAINMISDNVVIKVVGNVHHCDLPVCCYSSDYIYLLTATSNHGKYQQFILNIAQSKLTQICEVVTKSMCVMAILQPLTSTSATLTLLSNVNAALPVHKMLLDNSQDTKHNVGDIKKFISNTVQHFLPNKAEVLPKQRLCKTHQRPDHIELFKTGLIEDYFVPGSISNNTQHMCQLIQGNNSDNDELEIMQILQNKYMKDKSKRLTDKVPSRKSPRKLAKTPKKSKKGQDASLIPPLRRSPRKKPSAAIIEDLPKTILPPKNPLRKSRSHTAPTRSDLLWEKCRQTIKQKRKDSNKDTAVAKKKEETMKKDISTKQVSITEDLKTKDDMVSYMTKLYEEALLSSVGLLTTIQMLINVTVHFQQSQNEPNPQESACELIESCICLNYKQVKQKHKEFTDITFREYEFQVFLHLELETLLRDTRTDEDLDEKASEINDLLVPMGIARSGFVSTFLNTIVLENYLDSLPVLLCKIYDEMMLPLPPQLEGIFSPEISNLLSVSNPPSSIMSYGSSESATMLPGSNKSKRSDKVLNRYSSFHSVTSRQIALPKQGKKTQEKGPIPRRSSTRLASATKLQLQTHKVEGGDTQKVCKNLFGGSGNGKKLERRQSVAVMEHQTHIKKTPRKSKPRQQIKTPQSHHIIKNRRVTDTPAHKQRSNTTWHKQEKARRRTLATETVQLVPESPYRAPAKGAVSGRKTPKKTLRKTPKKTPRAALLKRKSFYSMPGEIQEKFDKLEARLTNKILSPTYSETKAKGLAKFFPHTTSPPRRIQPRMLFSNLTSPSPKKPPIKVGSPTNFDSPCKGTRSQTSDLRNIMDNKTELALHTPKKIVAMKLFQSPVPNRVRQDVIMSPRSILSPSKGKCTPRKSVSYVLPNSPLIHRPGKESSQTPNRTNLIRMAMSPFRRSPKTQVCLDFAQGSCKINSETDKINTPSKANELIKSNSSLTKPLTRSQTKSTPSTADINVEQVQRARTNLTNFFSDDSNSSLSYPTYSRQSAPDLKKFNLPRKSLICEQESTRSFGSVTSKSDGNNCNHVSADSLTSQTSQTIMSPRRSTRLSSTVNEHGSSLNIGTTDLGSITGKENADNSLKRKTISSMSKRFLMSTNDACQKSYNSQNSGSTTPSKKRKISSEKSEDTQTKRQRNSILCDGSMMSLSGSQEYFDSEEVFIETENGRSSERPCTKSSLFSHQSNSSHGFYDSDIENSFIKKRLPLTSHFIDRTNSSSNMSAQSEPVFISKIESKDSFESLDSAVFPSIQAKQLLPHIISNVSDTTVDSEISTITGFSKTIQHSLSDLASSEVSAPPSPVFKSVIKCDNVHSSPEKIQSPFVSPSRRCDRVTPSISPSGNTKYSPLTSAKSLVMLMESPLVNGTGERRKCKKKIGTPRSQVKSENVEKECIDSSTNSNTTRRETRRSLYRTKTNLGLS